MKLIKVNDLFGPGEQPAALASSRKQKTHIFNNLPKYNLVSG